MSPDTPVASIGVELNRFLAPDRISYRKGEGGRMLAYAEGHEVIGLMNSIFGWDAWSTKVVNTAVDFADVSNGGKWNVSMTATVRVTVTIKEAGSRREVWHEDLGCGYMENAPSRAKAIEKCKKEAVTDALKRAARQFGYATGGCLYSKEFLDRVKRVRGPAARIDFSEEELLWKPMNRRERLILAREQEEGMTGMLSARPESAQGKDEGEEDWDDDGDMERLMESEELVTV